MSAVKLPPAVVPALVAEIRAGLPLVEAARRYDVTGGSVIRAAIRAGLDARCGYRPDLEAFRREILAMPPASAVADLLDLVEAFFPSCDAARLAPLTSAGFTPQEARIVATLADRPGAVMSLDVIAARAVVSGDAPSNESLRVRFSTIRRKLRGLGWPVQIVTEWGIGVSLVVTRPGWSWS